MIRRFARLLPPGFLVLGLFVLLRGARVSADDKETPVQREARLAAEFVVKARTTLEAQSGYHIQGSFRLSTAGPGGNVQNIDFDGVVRSDQVTQLTLKAPELDPKAKLPAYKTITKGIVHLNDKMGWVEFDRLPTNLLTALVQSPPETFNLIWMGASRVELSSKLETVDRRSCHLCSIPLSEEVVRALAARFLANDGALAEGASTAHATLWVGEDGLVYRVALKATMVFMMNPEEGEDFDPDKPNPGIGGVGSSAPGHATEGPKTPGLVTRTYDVHMDISNYGKDVEFKIPADAQKRLQ